MISWLLLALPTNQASATCTGRVHVGSGYHAAVLFTFILSVDASTREMM